MALTKAEQARRDQAAAESSDALAGALHDANFSQTEVAELIPKMSQKRISLMADRRQDPSITLRDARLLPEEVQIALLRRLAALVGHLLVPKPTSGERPFSMALALELQKETSEGSNAFLELAMKGVAARGDTAAAKKELLEAAQAVANALQFIDHVERNGVAAIPGLESER